MNGSIAPALVEETSSTIQVLEVVVILLATEEVQVSNLEVGPEMAGRISVGNLVVLRTDHIIRNPIHHVVLAQITRIRGKELLGLGPEGLDGLRRIIQVDSKAVGLVVILHIAEYVIIDTAEEFDLGLNAPIVAILFEGGVLVEHAAVPTAHLVVGDLVGILNVFLQENLSRLLEKRIVNPLGYIPVFLRYQLCGAHTLAVVLFRAGREDRPK